MAKQSKYQETAFLELLERVYYDNDSKARDEFIEINIPLVKFVAKRYTDKGVDYEDLVQEGIGGLIRATEKFNPELGFKFGTYATWWIKQAIEKSILNNSGFINKPANYPESLKKIMHFKNAFLLDYNRLPTDDETSQALNITKERIKALHSLLGGVKSLDDTIMHDPSSGEDFKIVDNIPAEPDKYFEDELSLLVKDVIDAILTDKEKQILEMRFGLNGTESRSLRDIGAELNISQERVRQIECKAIRKLRYNSKSRALKAFKE